MKRILCLMIVLVMVGMVSLPVFATSPTEYDVKYSSKKLYKADVSYEKEYRVTYKKLTNMSTGGLECEVKVTVWNDTESKVFNEGNSSKFDSVPEYKIELRNGNGTFKTKKGTLEKDELNEIKIKKKNSAGYYWKYKIDIKVKELDTNEINKSAEKEWELVEAPDKEKWKTPVFYGGLLNVDKMKINLLWEKVYITSKDVYGISKIRLNNIPYFTDNTKLDIGDNTLEKEILYDPRNIICGENNCEPCWYKWEFVLNLSKDEEPTPTPSDDPIPTPSDDPTPTPSDDPDPTPTPSDNNPISTPTPTPVNTNYYGDTLPQTGEGSPTAFILIGICIACIGLYGLVRWKIKNMTH